MMVGIHVPVVVLLIREQALRNDQVQLIHPSRYGDISVGVNAINRLYHDGTQSILHFIIVSQNCCGAGGDADRRAKTLAPASAHASN